jgi:hypothetical protein
LMQSVSRDAGAATMVLGGKVGAIVTHDESLRLRWRV